MTAPVLPTGTEAVVGEVEYLEGVEGDGILPRDVVVWLPPSYRSDPRRRYPVLYMHDGHNLLDPATSYAGMDWAIDEVATQLVAAGRIREFLLVGPYCSDDRFEEYGYGERGRSYLGFLTQGLKPRIDARYRTLPGREDTFTMGSSMGGLIALLAVWWHPDVFSGAGSLSPYLPDELVADVEESDGWPPAPVRLYVDNGGDELDDALQPNVDLLVRALSGAGFTHGTDLEVFRDPGAPHDESGWSKRVWRPLEFLLGPRRRPPPHRSPIR